MRKVCDWVFGSFFRTIGRVLVFILIGVIISRLVDIGGLIDSFSITDLFFEKVEALEFTGYYTNWYNDNGQQMQQMGDFAYIQQQLTSNNTNWFNFYYNADKSGYNVLNNRDYLEITSDFSLYLTGINTEEYNTQDTHTCVINRTANNNGDYTYLSFTCPEISSTTETYTNNVNVAINPRIMYGNGVWNSCTFKTCLGTTCTLRCDLREDQKSSGLRGIAFNVNTYNTNLNNGSYIYRLSLTRPFNIYADTDTKINNSINNQTQQQHNDHQETQNYLEDTNTTQANTQGEDFINNFSNNSHGLTGIITAPLNAIQSIASATCSNLVLPLPFTNNKTLNLPCMSTIYTQHFGVFYTMYQGIILALISYWVCVRLFSLVKGFKDPEDDKIEVMDL